MTKKPQTVYRISGSNQHFTTISNALLQDRRISHETKGLLCELLSRPITWEITAQSIWKSGASGRDKVLRMIEEATKYGYIKSDRERMSDGTMSARYFTVHDGVKVEPLPGNQALDTTTWNPGTGFQGPIEKKDSKRKNLSLRGAALGFTEDLEGIAGEGWSLIWPQVDLTAGLCRVSGEDARKIVRTLAMEWAQQGAPKSALATLRRALTEFAKASPAARKAKEARTAPVTGLAAAGVPCEAHGAWQCSQCAAAAARRRREAKQ